MPAITCSTAIGAPCWTLWLRHSACDANASPQVGMDGVADLSCTQRARCIEAIAAPGADHDITPWKTSLGRRRSLLGAACRRAGRAGGDRALSRRDHDHARPSVPHRLGACGWASQASEHELGLVFAAWNEFRRRWANDLCVARLARAHRCWRRQEYGKRHATWRGRYARPEGRR